MKEHKLVIIVAGEASGDLHGSHLVKALRRMHPDVDVWGIGGEKMIEAGVNILFSSSEMAVVGLTEVFNKLGVILQAARELKSILKNKRPDLLVLIDYPDFNIHLAKTAKNLGIPVLYYISPQVWAWRKGRAKKIAARVDRMAVILPFEKDFYEHLSMNVHYVGHPLLDSCPAIIDKEALKRKWGVSRHSFVMGLLPGSRKEEIKNLLPPMLKAAAIIHEKHPAAQFFLPLAPTITSDFITPIIKKSSVNIRIVRDRIHEILGICDTAVVASGTATLETAIMGVPMVIVYKVSPVSYLIGKMIVNIPYIGLVNLVAGEGIVPELIQKDVTPERIVFEILHIIENDDVRSEMVEKLKNVKKILGECGASERTAIIAHEMMG